MEGHVAGVGSELLVEEVLELQRPAPLIWVGGVQRRLGVALLEGGDDRRRVADRTAVELEQGEGLVLAAGDEQRRRHVRPRRRRVAVVFDALPVQRPADLLAVVGDLDVPELRSAHCDASSHQ